MQNTLSEEIISSQKHSIESIVEAVVTANVLDDALIAYIKRIVEDAYQSERSSSGGSVISLIPLSPSPSLALPPSLHVTKRRGEWRGERSLVPLLCSFVLIIGVITFLLIQYSNLYLLSPSLNSHTLSPPFSSLSLFLSLSLSLFTVIPVYIKVLMSDQRVFTFQVGDIKTKRLQVIATMKSAIVEGGEVSNLCHEVQVVMVLDNSPLSPFPSPAQITLELYLYQEVKRGRGLGPAAIASAAGKRSPDMSIPSTFIRVIRRYNFTFVDSSNCTSTSGSEPEPRFFAKCPVESLAACVFLDEASASTYKSLYEKYRNLNRTNANANAKVSASTRDPAMSVLIDKYCSSIIRALESTDITSAMEKMLVLYCCFTPSNASPRCRFVQEVSALCTGLSGRLASSRLVVSVLRKTLDATIQRIGRCPLEWLETHDSPDLLNVKGSGEDSENDEEKEVLTLRRLYERVSQCFEVLRATVLAVLNDPSEQQNSSCEFEYLKPLITSSLWQLYDSETRTKPRMDKDPWRVSTTGLAGVGGFVSVIDQSLRRLELLLMMITSSISADKLDRLLMMESQTMSALRQNSQMPKPRNKAESTTPAATFAHNMAPRTIGEALGYCISIYEKKSWWRPVDITIKPRGSGGSFYHTSPASLLSKSEDEKASSKYGHQIWHTHRMLGNNWVGKLEALDFQASLVQYLYSQDGTLGMSSEGVVLRYLVESNVISALKDACFVVLTQPDRLQPFSTLCNQLFRRSAELNMFRASNESINLLMSKGAKLVQSKLRALCGASRIPLLLEKDTDRKPRFQGGIIGTEEILRNALGDWRTVYRFMWMVPAILPNGFVSPSSLKLDVYMGLSLQSALQIARPNIFLNPDEESFDNGTGDWHPDSDPDVGFMRHPGLIKLESIVRIEFESLESEAMTTRFSMIFFLIHLNLIRVMYNICCFVLVCSLKSVCVLYCIWTPVLIGSFEIYFSQVMAVSVFLPIKNLERQKS